MKTVVNYRSSRLQPKFCDTISVFVVIFISIYIIKVTGLDDSDVGCPVHQVERQK